MSYRSNIQASRINRGRGWKNLWIPNYKRIYNKYFIGDVFTLQYVNSKFIEDNKSNKTFMYYYDFALQKTFAKNFFIFKKYNVDLAWLIQAGYLGWFLALNEIFAKLVNTDFYATTIGAENFTNYFFWPQVYYYFYLLQELNNDYSVFDILKPEVEKFHEDDYSVLQLLSSSFFVTKNILTTKSNFLNKNEFDGFEFFHYTFIRHNIAKVKDDKLEPNQVFKEKFKLANFLFNPTFLKKYPNFIFFYNSWLHKSWQLSKRKAVESLKFFQSYYSPVKPVQSSINIFFSKMLKLFSAFKQLNMFIRNSKDAGVGITQEFIRQQINLLHLKLRIWDNMAFQIKEVWFYLKAYLRYFSYEGKINLGRSKIVFKKLFSFKKLLQTACTGISITTPSLHSFLDSFYFTIINKNILNSFLKIFFFYPNFLKNWYNHLVKFFIKILRLVRKIFRFRKINIFLKFFLLYTISNSFLTKNYKNFQFVIYPKNNIKESEYDFSSTLRFNINSLLFFYILSTYPELKKVEKGKTLLFLNIKNFFVPKLKLVTTSNNWKNFVYFYRSYYNMVNIIKHSNWLSILIFHPVIVLNFLKFTFTHKLLWRRKFDYFYFIISSLTPKLFFWIFSDLENLLHFTMFIHLFTIYWQNFFFFYLFVLKCLKNMYSQCNEDKLLYLTRPWIMFMQRSFSYNTILDLFSNAIVFYRNIGVYHLERSYFEGSQKPAFTIADLGSCLMSFGKANCWVNTTGDKFQPFNKFTYDIDISLSPFYIPFFGIWSVSKAFYKKNSNFLFDKKNWIDIMRPFFINRTVTHIILDHYSNLEFSSALIAVFIKKRLEREHKLTDILKNIGLLISQADVIKGFMLIVKGRFTWKERASKLWIRKGKLHQVNLWTKLDFYKTAVTVKFGVVSIRIWMLLENIINDLHAIV